MRNWKTTIDVSNIWNINLPINELSLKIKNIMVRKINDPDSMQLSGIIDELEYVSDIDHFDWLWDDFYDYCDNNDIWIKTF